MPDDPQLSIAKLREDYRAVLAALDANPEAAEGFDAVDALDRLWAALKDTEKALRELDRIHARLIAAVTPGHPGSINAKGPNSTPEDNDRYDALFSKWHAATRRCRALLGPNVHAEPNTEERRSGERPQEVE